MQPNSADPDWVSARCTVSAHLGALADVADLRASCRKAQRDNDLRLRLSPPSLADLRANLADISGGAEGDESSL